MKKPKPSVGRIVHYFTASDDGRHITGRHAAVITRVEAIDRVNLKVLPDRAPLFDVISVNLSEEPEPLHWTWPPRV